MKDLVKKLRKKAGFTLAELLIVVAIIAVLVAIAIPIFTSQLEKSRESTDLSNCRSYYGEIVPAILTGDLDEANSTINVGSLTAKSSGAAGVAVNGTFTVIVENAPISQTVNDWQTANPDCAGVSIDKTLTVAKNMNITYTFTVQSDGDANLTSVTFTS